MDIKINYIKDAGIVKKERLVLKILKDCNIGYYIVVYTYYIDKNDGSISANVLNSFWFPDKRVIAGDLVILYTKKGEESEKKNKDGSTSHFFYWGLDKTIWNEEDDCAVLIEIEDWTTKAAFP